MGNPTPEVPFGRFILRSSSTPELPMTNPRVGWCGTDPGPAVNPQPTRVPEDTAMFKRLKLGWKLTIGFGIVLVVMAALCAYALLNLQRANQTIQYVASDVSERLVLSYNIRDTLSIRQGIVRVALETTSLDRIRPD
jgi:hypothetical protein